MNWYYSDNEKAVGPLAEATMMELRACGMLAADTQVAKEGTEEWFLFDDVFNNPIKLPPVPGGTQAASISESAWSRVAGGVSSAAGLEKLEGASAKGLFGQLFQKRTIEDLEEHFAVGTTTTTPALDQVQTGWPAPWVFMRLLCFSVITTIGFFWAISRFDNFLLYPGWLFMGAFAVPFSVMIFFLETNILRNVSIYRVLKLLFLGGLMSLVFALVLYEMTSADRWFGAMAAGPLEELAKLLAVVLVARKWNRMHWTLNGMLLGAAVGAGFAAFETAGYILSTAVNGADETGVMILRALSTPFTHIIWTAATAGALWRFMGTKSFSFGMLKEWPVLRILLFVIGLHVLWNSPLMIPMLGDFMGYVVKWLILGIVGWILIILLIQDGLNQVKKAQAADGTAKRN